MADQVALVVIHGMGSQETGYSQPLREELVDRLGPAHAARTEWEEIFWADVLKEQQQEYLREANLTNRLDFIALRRFMVNAFGDAAAYRQTSDKKNTTYVEVHQRVASAIRKLAAQVPARTPLVVLAHSLGGHIMSNYIWDMQKPGATKGLGFFESMRTHAGMITFGCNIPFFALAYRKSDIKPIEFPGSRLLPADRDKARWLNFYDPDDVLGYPLRAINGEYSKTVDRDIPINVGGVFATWNPMSHQKYWTDNDFTKPTAEFLRTLLA